MLSTSRAESSRSWRQPPFSTALPALFPHKTVYWRPAEKGDMTSRSASLPRPPWDCRLRALCLLTREGWRPTALAVVAYGQTPVGPYREALVAFATRPWSARVPWIAVDDPASADAG